MRIGSVPDPFGVSPTPSTAASPRYGGRGEPRAAHRLAVAPPVTDHSSTPGASGHLAMSGTPEPNHLAKVAEEQHLAGRHHAALDALRPYFVARELDPAGAPAFVRHSLDISRVLREMGLAETAAKLWAAMLPGLAGGKSIDRARWILVGAEACEASHEGGCSVSRLADVVQQGALDAPAGPAQRVPARRGCARPGRNGRLAPRSNST